MHASQVWGPTSPRPPRHILGREHFAPQTTFRREGGGGERGWGGGPPPNYPPACCWVFGGSSSRTASSGEWAPNKGGGGGGSLLGVEAQQEQHTRRLHFFWGHPAAGRLCRQAQPRRLSLSSHMCAWDLLGLYMDSYIFLGLQEPPRPRNIME